MVVANDASFYFHKVWHVSKLIVQGRCGLQMFTISHNNDMLQKFSSQLANINWSVLFRGVSNKEMAFRDAYTKLGQLRSFISCPVVAMTATINYTIDYIKHSLNMVNCKETKIDIQKENIS